MGRRKLFWTVDCETDPFKVGRVPEPFIWGAYEGTTEQYEEFQTGTQCADFFRDKTAICYAHNGGKFDYHYLRDEINTDDPIMLINGRLAKFKIGECEFRDSLNIFPNTRLQDFGGKIEIEYEKMEVERRHEPNTWAEIRRYLKQDCVLLWEMIARYRKEYGTNLTQASASMKYFERMYGLQAPRQTKAQHDRYRPYYYGGRVQCFESGSQATAFSVADINSAYPYAMLSNHPFSTTGELLSELPKEKKIPQCLITLKAVSRGMLPWRSEDGKELYFPDDSDRAQTRTYHVTGWEYLAALEQNALTVSSIEEVHYFPLRIDFKDYIQKFYADRETARVKGDVAGRIFGKYFMNSLYGKFGANPEHYCEYVIASSDSLEKWLSEGFHVYKEWGARYLMERKPTEEQLNDLNGKWRFYNVATAASITGFVRATLGTAISRCAGVLYCDTDSIAARDVSALRMGTALGEWKHEGNFDRYSIAGKKLYAFHVAGAGDEYCPENGDETWKIASKGVNFAKLPNGPALITQIANGQDILFNPEVPTYSVTRPEPRFIARTISYTAKNMALAPDPKLH